jgi:glycosyltransferase involved in cell wall biosynthesis
MQRQSPEEAGRGVRAPRVTVVIPTYNRPHWLADAIGSVLEQSYDDFSLVVSDNASTDATESLVRRFDDPRVRYVRQPVHLDLNAHFTRCLELGTATSEYAFLLPDDDLMLPRLLETAVDLLDRHPNVGLVHSAARMIDAGGNTIDAAHSTSPRLRRDVIESGRDFIRAAFAEGYRVHGSTVTFRAAAVSGERYDLADYPATDFALMLRLALRWDIAFVAAPLAAYRIHDRTYTSAAGAEAVAGGYIQGTAMITALRDAKLRFLDAHAAAFEDSDRLRRLARRVMRRDLVARVGRSVPDRGAAPTIAALGRDLRLDPLIALEPAAWRLVAANLLGRRLRGVLRTLLRTPRLAVLKDDVS